MKRIPPDPKRLEQYQQRLRAFAEHRPFPVFGLWRPVPAPAFLAEWHSEHDVVVSATLGYGDWRVPAGPFLLVTTEAPGSAGRPADLVAELRREIREGKLPPASGEPVHERTPRGELCRLGASWALRTAVGDQAVTVLGHGPAPAEVELGPVADLTPYVAERNAFLEQVAAEQQAWLEPELAHATGVAAVRAYLETYVPGGPEAGAARQALSRRAVTELDAVLGCGPERSEYLVYSMVNQLTHLRERVPWYTEEHGPREAALEEMLRYVGLNQPVTCEEALLRWERYWSTHDRLPNETSHRLLLDWVTAWVTWAAGRER
ncbi:hypothetical protein [Kitasatospora sp. LaBMicrA B282]|uniref:hypothetical protein n=1 Tax=Kitasatospora sp. LaBMicrA B282 TaxID=3420949 RepID=UPI003D0C8D2F